MPLEIRGGGGSVPPGTFARVKSVHVDDYGAVGDGSTDDTAAIASAVAAVAAGGVVEFGPKTYKHTGITLTQSGVSLIGSAFGRTRLQLAAGTTADSVTLNPTGTTFKNPYNVRDIDIYGVTGSGHGLRVRYASVVNLANVRIYNHGGDGVRLYEVTAATLTSVECRDNGGNGITLGKKSDAVTLVGCSIFSNDGWGLAAGADAAEEAGGNGRINGVTAIGSTFIQNTLGGVWVRAASSNGVSLTGCYFETNGSTQHIKIGESGGATVHPVRISSCYFNHNSTTSKGIDAYNVTALLVEGCFFEAIPAGASNGGVKLNVASTPWILDACTASGGAFTLQDSAGTNWIDAAVKGLRVSSGIKLGNASPSGAADITVDRNGTESSNAMRLVQSGAGAAGTALLAVQADGTTTTSFAAYLRSRGTGSIATFVGTTTAGTVLEVLTNGQLRLGASGQPLIVKGTGTPEGSVSAPVGSTYHRTDGGAGTSFYVKESGTGNTGWVAK